MVWKVLFGAGMSLLEPLRLAPLESLLPSGTSQLGPPVFCTKKLSQTNTQSQLKEIYYAKKNKEKEIKKERKKDYYDCGVSSSNGQNISTRNSLRTLLFQGRFDLINDFKASSRVSVWI